MYDRIIFSNIKTDNVADTMHSAGLIVSYIGLMVTAVGYALKGSNSKAYDAANDTGANNINRAAERFYKEFS